MMKLKESDSSLSSVGDGRDNLCDQVLDNKGFGDRKDNKWLQYDYSTRPLSQEQWDKPYFQHKRYIGYYTWPK